MKSRNVCTSCVGSWTRAMMNDKYNPLLAHLVPRNFKYNEVLFKKSLLCKLHFKVCKSIKG